MDTLFVFIVLELICCVPLLFIRDGKGMMPKILAGQLLVFGLYMKLKMLE
jgi:hypothetical protein